MTGVTPAMVREAERHAESLALELESLRLLLKAGAWADVERTALSVGFTARKLAGAARQNAVEAVRTAGKRKGGSDD